jgi:ribosome-associated protein
LFASGGHNEKGILRKNMELKLRDEFIKLGQAMKAAGIVSSGIDAKMLIQDGQVTVNGEVETRRGRKLYDGDVFEFEGDEVRVVK